MHRALRACASCRRVHTACDNMRPCGRCVALGRADECMDLASKKRGRPRRNGEPAADASYDAFLCEVFTKDMILPESRSKRVKKTHHGKAASDDSNAKNVEEQALHASLSLALEELKNFKQLTQKLVHEQQLMREQMTSLSDTMTQQTNLQNQLPIGFKGFTSTVHEQHHHHQHQQHQQHIAIEKSLARRLEAIKRLPFLSAYPITDCSLPFVVDDIEKKPTVALVVKGPVGPAVYFYVNEAFCRQFKYSYDEFIGYSRKSVVKLSDEPLPSLWTEHLVQRTSLPMSHIIHWKQRLIDKEGTRFQAQIKLQYFYANGFVKWAVFCMDPLCPDSGPSLVELPAVKNCQHSMDDHEDSSYQKRCEEKQLVLQTMVTTSHSPELFQAHPQGSPGTTTETQAPASLSWEVAQIPLVGGFETFETSSGISVADSSDSLPPSPLLALGYHTSSSSSSSSPESVATPVNSEEPSEQWIERVMYESMSSPLSSVESEATMSPLFSAWMKELLPVECDVKDSVGEQKEQPNGMERGIVEDRTEVELTSV